LELSVLRQSAITKYAVLTIAVVAATLVRAGQQPAEKLDLATIVSRMEQATERNRENYRPYIMTREYRLYGDSENERPKSAVTAEISFVPPNEKSYTIERAEGSGRGRAIVQNVLRNEAEAAKDEAAFAVNSRSYDFTLLGEEVLGGHPCYVFWLKAKRDDKRLINGRAWVDKNTYLVRRIDGDLAKNPSWWLKRVHLTMDFTDVDGMRLLTGMRAVADVRAFGSHIFVGQAVRVETGTQEALLQSSVPGNCTWRLRRRMANPGSVLGAAIR
jgi:hypothetical protein